MNDYSVTAQVRPSTPTVITDDQVDQITDQLVEHHGSFAGNPVTGDWSITISLNASDPADAVVRGRTIAEQLARATALPAGPLVRLEAVRGDVLDEENGTPNYPDLVSGPEAAKILGVSRQRVHKLAQTQRFPTPLYELAVGSLWVRAGIEKFADEWDRRPGRRAGARSGEHQRFG